MEAMLATVAQPSVRSLLAHPCSGAYRCPAAAATVLVRRAALILVLVSLQAPRSWAADLSSVCYHHDQPNVANSQEIAEGETVYKEINANQTHLFFYSNFDVAVMNKPDQFRKLIINLEPCRGIVYLFVRKTRPCHPNPYSCINMREGDEQRNPLACTWTHFMSDIDGSRDGMPTFFEVPLSSTKFYLSVFAVQKSEYTLTLLADTGAFPRPGNGGRITAKQTRELQVQIEWDEAVYTPAGTTTNKKYWVYSSMLLKSDNRTNPAVLMRPDKIMNTVCGLQNNTDRQYTTVPAADCVEGKCTALIDPVISDKRYIFNVVAESERGYRMAYAGLIMRTDWEIMRQAASDQALQVVGVLAGSVLAALVIIYFLILKIFS